MADDAFIDAAIIQQLRNDIGESACCQILTSFIEETQIHLQHIKQAIAQASVEDLQSIAHALKGAAGMIGAVQLHEKLQVLEQTCIDNEASAIECAKSIESIVAQTITALQKCMAP